MNLAITELKTTEANVSKTKLNNVIHATGAAASVTTKEAGYFPKAIQTGASPLRQSLWINNIQSGKWKRRESLMKLEDNQHY